MPSRLSRARSAPRACAHGAQLGYLFAPPISRAHRKSACSTSTPPSLSKITGRTMGRSLAGVWLLISLLLAVAAAAAATEEPETTEVQSSYIVHVAPGHAPRSSRPRLLSSAYTSFLRDQLPTHLRQPAGTPTRTPPRASRRG